MKDFRRGGGFKKSFGGRSNFGGGSRFGGGNHRFGGTGGRAGGDHEFKEMFHATCADCGKDCEVPFRPSCERPVYCRDCFAKNAPVSRDFGPRDSGSGFKKPFNKFADRGSERPSFSPASAVVQGGDVKKQLEMLNAKLDRLIESLNIQRALRDVPGITVEVKKPAEKKDKVPEVRGATKKSAKKTVKVKKTATKKN